MRARYIREVGVRGKLRIYWDRTIMQETACKECPSGTHLTPVYQNECPNTYGTGKPGMHNAYTPLGDKPQLSDWFAFGHVEDYPAEQWPTACAHCGAPVPAEGVRPEKVGEAGLYIQKQVAVTRLYDSPSGDPEPGDVYKLDWHDPGECPYWENCDGIHVYARVPNGDTWDIDARANNCTMPQDRTHRCWVKTGTLEGESLHVDKNGHTCAAGAGSIQTTGWHGFLHGFSWTGC